MNLQALGLSLAILSAFVRADELIANRILSGEATACKVLGETSDSCLVDPKPFCTPFRSVDHCAESFQSNIQRRTSFVKNHPINEDGIWFHHLDDKLAGYKVAASLGLNPPKIHYCTDDVSSLSDNVPPGTIGFVVRATGLHSNDGVFVLPDGFGGKELISGMNMTAQDIELHLSALSVKNVVIEEYVGSSDTLPLEVKFHMFAGEVGSVNVVANRGSECACWAEMDSDQNRLDQFGCFVSGGVEDTAKECTSIDFQTGQKFAYPMKGMALCSDLPRINDCTMMEMISIAKKASEAIGVYVRVDMFLSDTGEIYLQEFTTNHMNGLRHCSAIMRDDGCLDPCFQGAMWDQAGGNATFGGAPAPIPDALAGWLALQDDAKKCEDVSQTDIKLSPAFTCLSRSSPVVAPVTTSNFTCPDGNEYLNITVGGTVELRIADELKSCTLVEVNAEGYLKPVGRSYSSLPWENVQGDYSTLDYRCEQESCLVDLPLLAAGSLYQLKSFDQPVYTADDLIARFFEQTTFGPTQTDIASFNNSTRRRLLAGGANSTLELAFASWVKDHQTSVPMTSHREFYRKRVNARYEFATRLGAVTHPCQENTRYRKFAFSHKDFKKILTIGTNGTKKHLSLDGFVRTIVDGPIVSIDGTVTFEDGNYLLCGRVPENYIGGEVKLETTTRKCIAVCFDSKCGNPQIDFDGGSPATVLTLDENEVVPIDEQTNAGRDPLLQDLITTTTLSDLKCSSIGEPGNPVDAIFGTYKGELWLHDPRFELFDNTIKSPSLDGGGSLAEANTNFNRPEFSAKCANVPSTFLNEDTCFISTSPNVCAIGSGNGNIGNGLEFLIPLDNATIRAIYTESGAGEGGSLYVYAIDQLRIEDDTLVRPPCATDVQSRWVIANCSAPNILTVETETEATFIYLISIEEAQSSNPYIIDVTLKDSSCAEKDLSRVGFVVSNGEGKCYMNVHPDHLNVYDFTPWTRSHPGNSVWNNPITEFAEAGEYKLQFPSWHNMSRWEINKPLFRELGRLGDDFNYYEIPESFRTVTFNQVVGFDPETEGVSSLHVDAMTNSSGTLVCGSEFEVANDPLLGGSQGRGAFDSRTDNYHVTSHDRYTEVQKRNIWTHVALEGKDQLRQRVAWALSQIFAVAPNDIPRGKPRTEMFVNYYDIFVRNAFGNYRDVLREVSHSTVMATMLTYYGSRSTAYEFERFGHVQFADENFSREAMQLFTLGLFELSQDGTQVLDENGGVKHVYSNDDIIEYGRAWTGFTTRPKRGNIEMAFGVNHMDPMRIEEKYRDPFPKMGLNRKYIGDGVPLCADLPAKHFLAKGATYKLLGRTAMPQNQRDPATWMDDPTTKRLTLEANGSGSLFGKLCGSANPDNCNFQSKIILDENVQCTGIECSVDTLRTVEISHGIFYEYIRPPCVYQAFYENAKVVSIQRWHVNTMCADPRTDVATTACCLEGVAWSRDRAGRVWNNTYWGERVTFATAAERCDNLLCTNSANPDCSTTEVGSFCIGNERVWTNLDCKLQVKIDGSGNAAIVHNSEMPEQVQKLVNEDTKTFFRVDWSNDGVVNDLISNCTSIGGCTITSDGMCTCEVTVSEEQMFFDASLPSTEEVLNRLHIGAFAIHDSSFVPKTSNGVTWYTAADTLTADSVFEVVDAFGVTQLRKNTKSTVSVAGANLSFRNPVHFMSLEDPEPRDAHYETEAVLDSYFYHSNIAPFLAIRFAQRFGISNPSPGFVKRIANAFKSGSYSFASGGTSVNYGTGSYGDLAATFACVVLDPEARSAVLDADPAHGGMKEPLMKIISLMRSMNFKLFDSVPLINWRYNLGGDIGQMAHDLQSVFSFFLPEHKASGPVAQASLVAPEGQHITGPKIVNLLNGMFGLIKYGLDICFNGFGTQEREQGTQKCSWFDLGSFDHSNGRLTYTPSSTSPKDIVDELSTLLTAGRLNAASRKTIEQIFADEPDQHLAIVKAQMAIVTAPEFHVTNTVKKTGVKRPKPAQPVPSSKPYKVVVHILNAGGFDSWNMLVPHTCNSTNASGRNVREQYNDERGDLAFTDRERTRIIEAANQPCQQFAVHPDLPIVEQMYKEGDVNFFSNVGVLNAPVTKSNYKAATRTTLFGHNTMQEEVRKNDPFDGQQGTGVLGRACDQLNNKGFSAMSITLDSTIASVGKPGVAVDPLIMSYRGMTPFNTNPWWKEKFDPRPIIDDLNDETELHSSLFGETWSSRLNKAVSDNAQMGAMLDNVTLTQSWWQTDESTRKFKATSDIILTHKERGSDRDVIYFELPGWDMHSDMKARLKTNFIQLNTALTTFKKEMEAQGLWDSVAVVITSDFGRSLTANSGLGSDHAWGGNYFVAGGSVNGGQVLGKFPKDLTEAGDLNIGRGRLLPTSGWESIWNSVVGWMGVETDEELDYCLPNRIKTGAKLYTKEEVFTN
mmetsp:Transcript_3881/g.6489  ORF Transcript_3881/g.6489 Transcript_3881/m.6489 type:complete len:2423 (+) Transcript_3881:72-7340(+)